MTEKQKLFAETYLANGFNARVAEYINKRREEIYDSLNVDATRVMQEIADIAFELKNDKNVASKLKALELLSKNLSLQTVKNENKDVIEVKLVEDESNV